MTIESIQKDGEAIDLKQAEQQVGAAIEDAQTQASGASGSRFMGGSSSMGEVGAVVDMTIMPVLGIGPALTIVTAAISAFQSISSAQDPKDKKKSGQSHDPWVRLSSKGANNDVMADKPKKPAATRFGPFRAKSGFEEKFASPLEERVSLASMSVNDNGKKGMKAGSAASVNMGYLAMLKNTLADIGREQQQGPQIVADATIQGKKAAKAVQKGNDGVIQEMKNAAPEAQIIQQPAPPKGPK